MKSRHCSSFIKNVIFWILISVLQTSSSRYNSNSVKENNKEPRPIIVFLNGNSLNGEPVSDTEDEKIPYTFLYLYKLAQEIKKKKLQEKPPVKQHRSYDELRPDNNNRIGLFNRYNRTFNRYNDDSSNTIDRYNRYSD